jgi:hypothetical protein
MFSTLTFVYNWLNSWSLTLLELPIYSETQEILWPPKVHYCVRFHWFLCSCVLMFLQEPRGVTSQRMILFITVFARALCLSLSWVRWIQSIPLKPVSLISFLIVSTHQCLDLPGWLFPYGFQTNSQYAFFSSHIHATCLDHLIILDFSFCLYLAKSYEAPSCQYFLVTNRINRCVDLRL